MRKRYQSQVHKKVLKYYIVCLLLLTDVNPESPEHYLVGHCIDGRVLYPATGYLVLAWRTLARSLGTTLEELPIMFEDVTIHQATILPKKGESNKVCSI